MRRRDLGALACALVGAASSSCGPAPGAVQPPPDAGAPPSPRQPDAAAEAPPSPRISIAGRWGMRQALADSVAAELIQDGAVLTGTLCAGGLPTDPADRASFLCGPIVDGRIEGRHVRFGAKIMVDVLSIDAEVSVDGTRMGGQYVVDGGRTQPTAWWPLDARSGWVDPHEGWPSDLLPFSCDDPTYNPGYDLTLVDAPAGSAEFTPDRTYLVVFCAGIAGDLGAFGGADLHVTAEGGRTTMIVAGPVPETTPTLPTTVTLHFAGGLLTTVEARTPSGATYSFRATRSPGGRI